ncbi:hypothetical protein CIK99_14150 [Prevotella sp. P5-92]|uniref:hypothetical protein n=1 Tax=Prevotella sp. P5-92 TaxID=2024222 RepID=UPI000B95F41C|nr:hypothetical protein [Prevotella sp. P5-92]OYP54223.1 hypothetical protein CIK99_14150 [Prevotella sp. P5-92]
MNQIIKEECPYCENYVTGQMRDTNARKATRWATKKGITSGIEHIGNIGNGFIGTCVANGVKILAGDKLDQAGKYVESQMFEIGDFDFSCPHCRRHWERSIPHNVGNLTLGIDHDYVKFFYNKELRGRFTLIVLSIIVSALNLGLLYLCYNWCSGLSSTTMEHTNGFFGLGAKDYEAVNYTFYFAWLLFIGGLVSNWISISWISDKYTDWKTFRNEDFKQFRFKLLTNQCFNEKDYNTSGIDVAHLCIGLLTSVIAAACGSYCYFNDLNTFVKCEPTIWNLGQDTKMETDYLWYFMALLAFVFGIIAIVNFANITKNDNKTK